MAFLWKCNIWRQTIVSRDKGIRGSFSLDQLFLFSTYLTKNIARIVNFVGVANFLLDFNLKSWFEMDNYNLSMDEQHCHKATGCQHFCLSLALSFRFFCCYCFLCCRRFHCRCSYHCFEVWFSEIMEKKLARSFVASFCALPVASKYCLAFPWNGGWEARI